MPNNYLIGNRVQQGASTNDPLWDNVVALFSMEGSDGSTVAVDLKGRNVASLAGGAIISTGQKKLGESSLYAPGSTGGLMTITNSPDTVFEADYCIDFWARSLSLPAYATMLGNSGGTFWTIETHGGGEAGSYMAGVTEANHVYTGGGQVVLNNWAHFAVARQGDQLRFFYQGNLVGVRTVTGTLGGGNIVAGGRADGNGMFNGYIDMIRLTKGVARFTANFNPELLAY